VCRLRGTGGDLIILEEAAFIPQDVWLEVVIPLIEVRNTALVAISTPLDSSNYYSTLIAMKDEDGKDVFDVLQAQAACAACVEQLDDPSKCPHVQLERPSWKSKEKQQVVKAMYEGNQQTLMRESMGIVTETSGGVFLKHLRRDRPVRRGREQVRNVFGVQGERVHGRGGARRREDHGPH
jgi:hypothetical protein